MKPVCVRGKTCVLALGTPCKGSKECTVVQFYRIIILANAPQSGTEKIHTVCIKIRSKLPNEFNVSSKDLPTSPNPSRARLSSYLLNPVPGCILAARAHASEGG